MSKLSAVILTKNAEDLLADCIDSLKFCDEIIVIDDSSADRTVELAKHLGAKVYADKSVGFAEKRNFGLSKVKSKWVLYVDADERVSSELAESIKYKVSSIKDENSAYKVLRKNFYFGNHEWPQIEKLERLFIKNDLEEWYGDLHETAKLKVGAQSIVPVLDGFLLHYTHRDLTSMVEKTIKWSEVEANLRLKAHHPQMSWWRFFRVMVTAFYDSYVKQKGYKAGTAGLIESIYQSFSIFITYARLWEKQQEKQGDRV
jgi:glycosyltransferase involved in cell wall biosynthesis